jgi:CelD/BcsL family acetyltransferase involved in cellulose biosynthesis
LRPAARAWRPAPFPVTAFHTIDIDPRTDARWDGFVADHPDALVFHHSAWLAALEEAYGYRPRHLACEARGGELAGILPLVFRRGVMTGRTLSSLPHSPVAGPLVSDPTAASLLIEAAIERTQSERRARLQLRTAGRELDGIGPSLAGRPGVMTYVVRLPDPSEQLRFGNSRNHGAIKRAVQKAAKAGVDVRAAQTLRDVGEWYDLYVDTTRTHGAVPHSRRFFDVIWELLRPYGLVELLLAERRDGGGTRLLAGSLFFHSGKRSVFFAFNGRRPEALSLRPNDAIHWRSIHDAWKAGVQEYDLGEAEGNPGLIGFKRKWGGEPRRLYRYYFPSARDSALALEQSDSRLARAAEATWRHLPTRATERLGDALHRYL